MTTDNRPLFDDPADEAEYQALRAELVWCFRLSRTYGPQPWIEEKIDDAMARISAIFRGTVGDDEPGMIPRAFLD